MEKLYHIFFLLFLLQVSCSPKPVMTTSNVGSDKYFDKRVADALGSEEAGWLSVKRNLTAIDFGAIPNDRKDDTEALQKAFDYGEVWIDKGTYNVSKTLYIKKHGTQIRGQAAAEIIYTGQGSAISSKRVGKGYPVSCELDKISITLTASNQIGFDIKLSHSQVTNCTVKVVKNNSVGFSISGDGQGTGSYCNIFSRCNVQGDDFNATKNQRGIEMTYENSYPSRCPNANVFIGGRIGQVSKGLVIRGAGNNFYSPTLEGISEKCMTFDHPTAKYGCLSNNVYSPYIEGGDGATAAYFGENARNCQVLNPFYTSLGVTGNLMKDNSLSQSNGLIVAEETTKTFSANKKNKRLTEENNLIKTGKGAPKEAAPNGTLYTRTDGQGQLYLRQNSKWVLIK